MARFSTVAALSALLVVLAGAGCKERKPTVSTLTVSGAGIRVAQPEAPDSRPRAPHDANDFTFALFRAAARGDEDLAVSGFVTRHAVAALSAASKDRPRITSRLGYGPRAAPGTDELAAWKAAASGLGFSVGASIFYDRSHPLRPELEARAANDFGEHLEPLDFKRDNEASRRRVGAWIGQATRGLIVGVPSEQELPPSTSLVVGTAFGLDARWRLPFEPGATRRASFTPSVGGATSIELMSRTDRVRYGEQADVQLLDLTFGSGAQRLSMLFVLPAAGSSLADVERELDRATYDRWVAALAEERVTYSLPRFSVHSKLNALPFVEAVLGDAKLDPASAFLRGDALPTVLINETLVKVDEAGAKAASIAVSQNILAPRPEAPPKEFLADRPFLFLIRDRVADGCPVLVMGRVTNPLIERSQ